MYTPISTSFRFTTSFKFAPLRCKQYLHALGTDFLIVWPEFNANVMKQITDSKIGLSEELPNTDVRLGSHRADGGRMAERDKEKCAPDGIRISIENRQAGCSKRQRRDSEPASLEQQGARFLIRRSQIPGGPQSQAARQTSTASKRSLPGLVFLLTINI
jgi:hypothetical protein